MPGVPVDGSAAAEPPFDALLPDAPLFDALLTPNDSGTRHGRLILAAVLSAYTAIVLVVWLALHFWPAALHSLLVGGFILWSVYGDARRRRERERIRVWPGTTRIERTDLAGRTTVSEWQTAWLRVAIDRDPYGHPRLRVGSHGRFAAIGSFLTEEERASLADALRAALATAPLAGVAGCPAAPAAVPAAAAMPCGR